MREGREEERDEREEGMGIGRNEGWMGKRIGGRKERREGWEEGREGRKERR